MENKTAIGNTPYIVGVDTGNRCIKTATQIMVAGLHESEQMPIFREDILLKYKNKYYVPTSKRVDYQQDKTKNDTYFILTLIAVMQELKARGVDIYDQTAIPEIVLAVGLPPAHLARLKDRFKTYFARGIVSFEYNEKPVAINIVDVIVAPQGYAALYADFQQIRKLPRAFVVDIGGYTTDVIMLENGKPNPEFFISENAGVIKIYNYVKQDIINKTGEELAEDQIDKLLTDSTYELLPGMKQMAMDTAAQYIDRLLSRLYEQDVNLKLSKAFFVGGGSITMQPIIEKSELVTNPSFNSNIRANACGYEAMAKAIAKKK